MFRILHDRHPQNIGIVLTVISFLSSGCSRSAPPAETHKTTLPAVANNSESPPKSDPSIVRTVGVAPTLLPVAATGQATNSPFTLRDSGDEMATPTDDVLRVTADQPVTIEFKAKMGETFALSQIVIRRLNDPLNLTIPTGSEQGSDKTTYRFTLPTSGEYEFSVQGRTGAVKAVLSPEPTHKHAPKILEIAEDVTTATIPTTYVTTLADRLLSDPIRLNPDRTATRLTIADPENRAVYILNDQGQIVAIGEADGSKDGKLDVVLSGIDGSVRLSVVDKWSLEGDGNRISVIGRQRGNPDRPVISRAATTTLIDPTTIPNNRTLNLTDGTLRLTGLQTPTVFPLAFELFKMESANRFVRSNAPRADLRTLSGGREWDARLNLGDTVATQHLFAVSETSDGQNYSLGLILNSVPAAINLGSKPTIGVPTVNSAPLVLKNPEGFYPTNAAQVTLSGTGYVADAALVILRDGVSEPVGFITSGASAWTTTVTLPEGTNILRAVLTQGNMTSQPSDPITIAISRTGPSVAEILPSDFGASSGPQTLTIRFEGNKLDRTQAEDEDNYTIKMSDGSTAAIGTAVPSSDFTAKYDEPTNTVALQFANLKLGNYRVEFNRAAVQGKTNAGLHDIFGNTVTGIQGEPAGVFAKEFVRGAATNGLAGLESATIPPGRQAPFVKYPEFVEPRDPTNGFNPSDKVQTRVVRLYYFRDAYRVAQIVNRHTESYNRVAVDTRRRLAAETRRQADQLTDKRKLQENDAIRAAQESRAAEKNLEQATQQAARLQRQGSVATSRIPRIQTDLTNAQNAVTNAPNDIDPEELEARKARVDDLKLALQDAQRKESEATDALPAATDQVAAAQRDVQAKREAEAAASQVLAREGFEEDRAREQQFRLEVAAAHEDPDTFAAGVPASIDPVEQVSVSVIGEGVIQLRGPMKGINIVRKMINEIDSPAGQVRIAIHSVQINGEHGDRMEKVAQRVKDYVDHSRFLTMQSAQLLRNAVVKVAARRASEATAQCPDGTSQATRDAKYIANFFGEDFLRELMAIDSEFLRTGNKVLSIHSMDSTSLASALFLMALAKNETRMEILDEFQAMLGTDLPAAELSFFEAGGDRGAKKHPHPKKDGFVLMAENARFQSLRGYFVQEVEGNDTLTPIQREFIRLAQIFKSRLVTELEYNQRVKERGLIEQLLGNRLQELKDQKEKERVATEALAKQREELNRQRSVVFEAFGDLGNEIGRVRDVSDRSDLVIRDIREILDSIFKYGPKQASSAIATLEQRNPALAPNRVNLQNSLNAYISRSTTPKSNIDRAMELVAIREQAKVVLADLNTSETDKEAAKKALSLLQFRLPLAGQATPFYFDSSPNHLLVLSPCANGQTGAEDLRKAKLLFRGWIDDMVKVRYLFDGFVLQSGYFERLRSVEEKLARLQQLSIDDDLKLADFDDLETVVNAFRQILTPVRRETQIFVSDFNLLIQHLGVADANAHQLYRETQRLRNRINSTVKGELQATANRVFDKIDVGFRSLLDADLKRQFAEQNARESRQPLDHKKLLDMLIDDMEDKYIELLEGTRSHVAVIDGYIKALATALDDDFNTQFYDPAFRKVREASRMWDVQLGQIEKTSVLTNNRTFAKVDPTATMEFDLPKRQILITEAMNGAKAMVDEYGALLNDPTFLSLTKLKSGQPTSSMAQGTLGGGASAVRSVLPRLSREDDEDVMRQAGPGRREFGSALEALIPDPAIYKFETGTGYEIRPVIQPDGQAVTFDFNYMYTTNVREPVRADEKHLGRVKRHAYDGAVQLSNYELREVTTYQVALKASRTSRGVPLLEDIPALGVLFRPLPSAESSLQENIILAQSTIFPTVFDLMGLRWAPAVADLDTLRLRNADFIVRGRNRDLSNRVFDYSTSKVDDFLRTPPAERRTDLYRSQETIPDVHPNGYKGPGLNLRDSHLRESYDPEAANPPSQAIPGDSGRMSIDDTDVGLPVETETVPLQATPVDGTDVGLPVEAETVPMRETPAIDAVPLEHKPTDSDSELVPDSELDLPPLSQRRPSPTRPTRTAQSTPRNSPPPPGTTVPRTASLPNSPQRSSAVDRGVNRTAAKPTTTPSPTRTAPVLHPAPAAKAPISRPAQRRTAPVPTMFPPIEPEEAPERRGLISRLRGKLSRPD